MRQYLILSDGDEIPIRVWDKVQVATSQFADSLAPSVPRPEIVLLTDSSWDRDQWRAYRRKTPYHRQRGVYLHFSAGGELLYVGKGTGKRNPLDRCWVNDPPERRWILGVIFFDEWAYFAHALETYMIKKMLPKYNRIKC